MGSKIKDILNASETSISELGGKSFVVDAFNMLYQFITTIRRYDGSLLMDRHGRTTSHLSGLFFRCINLMESGIKLTFVFDGEPPEIKKTEIQRRKNLKMEAIEKYELAVESGDTEMMKKYAGQTAYLSSKMIEDAKLLLDALGIPHVQAPSEGEAQGSYMVKKGEFDAIFSQDADCLIFGCPVVIKNLSVSGRRKKVGTNSYEIIKPEVFDLEKNLNDLKIDLEQLIVIAILCGTDFNYKGVPGIGPKKALNLVKKYGKDFDNLFKNVDWNFDYSWKKVYDTIKNIPVTDIYEIKHGNINEKMLKRIMIEEHGFSEEKIINHIEILKKKQRQKDLSSFF